MSSQYARLSIRTLVIAVLTTGLGRSHAPAQTRPAGQQVVGVAFGGGSARGLAHIGVIQWFEEHRIPIDVVAGTSMGGLVGGSFGERHAGRRTAGDDRGD
jgi:NTE family protein